MDESYTKMDELYTRIEGIWNNTPPGYTFVTRRAERYDPSSGFFYAPIEYETVELDYCTDELPNQEWVRDAFIGFVRGEFSSTSTRGNYPGQIEWKKRLSTSEKVFWKYRDRCESELLYSGLIDDLIQNAGPQMSQQLYALFTNPILGNKENSKLLNFQEFSSRVDPLIDQHDRLRFVLPSYPFKDQNIFRTEATTSHVDLGEIALIVRMHVLALAMFQVHPFGADWIIISDGLAYAPIFNVDKDDVMEYRERLLEIRNQLNIQGTVNFIDLKELTQRLHSRQAGFEVFDRTVKHIRNSLSEMVKLDSGQILESFMVLVRGMKWNINTRSLGDVLGREDLWTIVNTQSLDSVPEGLRSDWHEFDEMGRNAAYEYAAFNLALRYHSALDRILPNSLRATIHPKAGQIAVPTFGDVFPWNGVGVLRDENLGPTSVETWPLYKLFQQCPDAIPYLLHGQGSPLYYFCPANK
jgi:pyoverdine/dityrosine biosynthesis protein Dit1